MCTKSGDDKVSGESKAGKRARVPMGGLGCVICKVEKPSYQGTLEPRSQRRKDSGGEGFRLRTTGAQARRGVCLLIARNIQEPKVCVLVEEARGCRRTLWYGRCM